MKTDKEVRRFHGERIAARQKANRPWTVKLSEEEEKALKVLKGCGFHTATILIKKSKQSCHKTPSNK